ncbi:MAG: RDD family protein [Kiritimatiellae bacterium]|nr:RDD family protein [Kiritimatiellia bacterium]
MAAMQTSDQTEQKVADKPILAPRQKRLVGAVIDSLIMIAALSPFVALSGIIETAKRKESLSTQTMVIFALLGLALYVLIHGHLLIKYGQTVGKRLVGTRIVDLQGQIPPLERIVFLRHYLFNIVGYIPYMGVAIQILNILYIFHPDRRCLHDRVTGTSVLDAGPAPLWPWPTIH